MEVFLNPKLTKEEGKYFWDKLNLFPNFCKHSIKDTEDFLDSEIQLTELNEI